MSKRYWTADLHLGHGNVIDFCGRPFSSVEHMNQRLIAEINMRCKPEDTLVHVGDAVTKGVARGVEGLRLKWADYRKEIQCRDVVMLEGNHDTNNKTKTVGRHLICKLSHFRVFVTHYPTDSETHDPILMDWVHRTCDFALTGHVHEKWKHKWILCGQFEFLNINVGVDQWNYRPVSDDEILNYYLKVRKELEQPQQKKEEST